MIRHDKMWVAPFARDPSQSLKRKRACKGLPALRSLWLVWIVHSLLMAGTPLLAHTTGISSSQVEVLEDQVTLRIRINLREINFISQFDSDRDLVLNADELTAARPLVASAFSKVIELASPREQGKGNLESLEFAPDNGELRATMRFAFHHSLEQIAFHIHLHDITDSGHWHLAQIRYDGIVEERFFNLESPNVQIDLVRGWAGKSRMIRSGLVRGWSLVVKDANYLALVLLVLLSSARFSSVLRTSLVLVLAHLLGFLTRSFDWMTLPDRFIELSLLLAVFYTGLENLLVAKLDDRWLVSLVFGFLFGFAFLNGIQNWDIPRNGLVLAHASFDGGLLLGVLTVLCGSYLFGRGLRTLAINAMLAQSISLIVMVAAALKLMQKLV
ncbi:MAG: HupE/UreJ family protein [Acidobacteriota bacterium]